MNHVVAWCDTVCVDGHSTVLDWVVVLSLIPAVIICCVVAGIVLAWWQRHHG